MHYGGNFSDAGTPQYTKYYSEDGSIEIVKNNQTGEEKHILYLGGTPYDANIVYLKNYTESSGSFIFLHKDYLGSILAISNQDGAVLERRHYDAWGNLTHLQLDNGEVISDQEKILKTELLLDRGYTSHEHLAGVGLIHMNGRLYDPLLHRFLNADENIQDPNNTQNYNKYAYVLNNPLLYNDPSGEFLHLTIGAAILIGAIIGGVAYTLGLLVTTGSLRQWNIFDFGKSVIMGAISGATTFGIGQMFQSGGIFMKIANDAGGYLLQAGLHGVNQGVLAIVGSGNGSGFLQAFVSGALGSIAASGWQSMVGKGPLGTIAFGALSGGIGAELTSGNFFQGFVIGGVVAGLNHAMHQKDLIRESFDDPDGVPEANMNSVHAAKTKIKGLFTSDMNQYASMAKETIDLETNTTMAGKTDIDKVLITGSGKNLIAKTSGQISVTYYKNAFKSWYSLGSTILHEYYHVADYATGFVSGLYTSMYRKHGNTLRAAQNVGVKMETRAFNFIARFGASWSNFNNYRNQYGY